MPTQKSLAMFLFTVLVILINVALEVDAGARPFLVFGDSLVDNGNNNYLATIARADTAPYGIDYPTGRPTGRFSNGYNITDLISQALGSETTMPYLSPMLTGDKLLVGANFASAGVGILNDTGFQFANIIRINRQTEYLKQYKQRVSDLMGQEKAERHISQALTLITLGSNDFVNNYYLVPFSLRSREFALPDYVVYIISEYRKILMRLHELGLCRILVTGVGPIGCVPAELAQHSMNGECIAEMQRAADLFNHALEGTLDDLNREIGRTTFIGVNMRKSTLDFISDPAKYGFVSSKIACCGQGRYNGIGLCTAMSNLCSNREEYVFWDSYHPSEKAIRIIVKQILTGSIGYISPMNLSTIMALDAAENV